MTTTLKSLPPHGTQYRYKGAKNGAWPGCRCQKCTRAHYLAGTRRALAHLNGQPPLHPAEPVVEHINTCMNAGMSRSLIARRADVATSTIAYLLRGISKACRREIALKILAVRPGDFDDLADRPALGSTRRVQALYVIGHNPTAISVAGGLNASTISHLANGRYDTVDANTARAVDTAYRKLRYRQGDSRKAQRIALQAGWASPLAWDGNIDDPAAVPDMENPPDPELKRDELAALRRDEIWLLGTARIDPDEIARRLEISEGTAKTILTELRTGKRRDRKTKAVAA